ncbi:putative restrictase [Panus rudis PR-1116 ss-1]|nr:putative restrictase [Panus rudis PR-1116 ss-1]
MTASTHNAIDNVLERFAAANETEHLLTDEQILRSATESSKVNKALQKYTIDARIGGNMNDDPRLIKKAERRLKEARIVFTTCSGAGLGLLRNANFDTILIDEASQITEPVALIPLVKECQTAVLVGDHVQLRPTVRPMAKVLEFDQSLFERLWTGETYPNMTRRMLEVQYRFCAEIGSFPSATFYDGRLQTGNPRETEIRQVLEPMSFPWPRRNGRIFPVVFVPCAAEEDQGRSSKSNQGQVDLVKYILKMLRAPSEAARSDEATASIAILTPYSRQVKLLNDNIPSSANATVSTIDGFQGRETDIEIFSTVRCNWENDIGFVEDKRRLNVAWTRPKFALIIVGDQRTLSSNEMWKKALKSCEKVELRLPDVEVS